jgi:hypothetical protein
LFCTMPITMLPTLPYDSKMNAIMNTMRAKDFNQAGCALPDFDL